MSVFEETAFLFKPLPQASRDPRRGPPPSGLLIGRTLAVGDATGGSVTLEMYMDALDYSRHLFVLRAASYTTLGGITSDVHLTRNIGNPEQYLSAGVLRRMSYGPGFASPVADTFLPPIFQGLDTAAGRFTILSFRFDVNSNAADYAAVVYGVYWDATVLALYGYPDL